MLINRLFDLGIQFHGDRKGAWSNWLLVLIKMRFQKASLAHVL